ADASTAVQEGSVRRVLIITMPGVSWKDLKKERLPHLDRLFHQSALAVLTTRTIGFSGMPAGYLTLGAGSRAAATELSDDGAAFEVDEQIGASTAGDAYAQRTGRTVGTGIVQLGIKAINELNDSDRVDNQVGALGDALARAGYARAVIAGSDGRQADDHL